MIMNLKHGSSRQKKKMIMIKWLIMLLVILLIGTVFIIEFNKARNETLADVWKSNWNINIPAPQESQTILQFPGRDYVQYTISQYNKSSMKELMNLEWENIGNKYEFLTKKLNQYKSDLKSWYPKESVKVDQIFTKYPPIYNEQDYYLIVTKEDGSYMIALLNMEQRKIYALEAYL